MIQHKLTENYLREGETHGILYLIFFFPLVIPPPHPHQGRGKRGDIGTSATDSHGCVWQRLCSFLAGPSPRPQRWGPGYPASRDFSSQGRGLELPPRLNEHNIYPFSKKRRRRWKGPSHYFGAGRLLTCLNFFQKGEKKEGKNPPELAAPHVLVEMLQTWLPLTSAT